MICLRSVKYYPCLWTALAMGAKKTDAAKGLLSALEARKKLLPRTVISGVIAVAISSVIGVATQFGFGAASVLIFGLLVQYSHERVKEQIDVRIKVCLKDLGWKEIDLEKEAYIRKLENLAKAD